MVTSGWRCSWALLLLVVLGCGSRAQAEARSPHAVAEEGSHGYEYAGADEAPSAPGMPEPTMAAPLAPPHAAPPPPPMPQAAAPGGGVGVFAAPSLTPAPGPSAVRSEREARAPLLIYTASLTLAVFGTDAALDAVEQLARERRGYLVRRSDTSITIRVPAEVFEEALSGVGKLGDELHREVSAQDVTDEFADLQIRLRNSEVVRQRLEQLLARADKVEDALAVERELERVTRDIEQIKGRLALLGELLRFSTITVNFQARAVETVARDKPLPFDWLHRLGLSHLLSL